MFRGLGVYGFGLIGRRVYLRWHFTIVYQPEDRQMKNSAPALLRTLREISAISSNTAGQGLDVGLDFRAFGSGF